ncbi:PhoPQ-activated protein PqaA family protein, partial [Singulisphaera rosea]
MSLFAWGLFGGVTTGAELDDYVSRDDPTFSWKVAETIPTKEGTIVDLPLVSQTWHGIVWKHRMRVYESSSAPSDPNTFLLFITGGGTNSRPNEEEDQRGLLLAKLSGARVAILPQVPNQPLLGDKVEDTLIAETFVRYLETRDATWPLLFPMVKSAVRAMDAVQAWSKESGKPVPSKFVVTGASKRGWTTWLTGAYDPRVVAIAPMVIDTLNFRAQRKHYLEVWGKPSEEIDDYTKRGLNDVMDKNEGEPLWKMVDPYMFLNRLTKPKLIINGTNDPYWTVDALNIYWGELKGPKSVVYLPNAGHGLEQHRDYALGGIGALVRHTIAGKSFPDLSWTHSDSGDGGLRLTIES